jgi:glycosyltransferase involved in cell wall biosynthesis
MTKKFSILIPTRNRVDYLPSCLYSVLDQNYSDVEVIVSNNFSSDETQIYLDTLSDARLKVVKPPTELSMTKHYEWILAQAKGEWILILGDDDGLQPYFFKVADYYTNLALKMKIRAINSKRSYFFWKGCEEVYGDIALDFFAQKGFKIRNGKIQSLLTLAGLKSYFELPQMYSNSIFNKSLIEDAKKKQNGLFYSSINPDANGAAIACSLDENYLDVNISFGWIGSSPKSTGIASAKLLSANSKLSGENCSANDFFLLNSKSELRWNNDAGDIAIFSLTLFYWEALLQSRLLHSPRYHRLYHSMVLKYIIFSSAYNEIRVNDMRGIKLKYFEELIRLNSCSLIVTKSVGILLRLLKFTQRGIQYFFRKFNPAIQLKVFWSQSLEMNISDAYTLIKVESKKNPRLREIIKDL